MSQNDANEKWRTDDRDRLIADLFEFLVVHQIVVNILYLYCIYLSSVISGYRGAVLEMVSVLMPEFVFLEDCGRQAVAFSLISYTIF